MGILLYCESGTDARIATPARLGKEAYPPRHYQAEGHFLLLDGPGHVIDQDAADICKLPGWRLATPQEQNQWTKLKRKASQVEEAAPAPAAPVEASAPAPSEPTKEAPAEPAAPAAPPAPASQVLTTDTAPKAAGGKG